MEKEKWYEKLKAQGQSITVPMTLLMIAVAVIPLFLQTWILIGSFKQNQIEARSIEIQNQCVILSNRMTRSGYMTADKANNVSLDAQMQTIADLYNGRIVIVNSSYKIMTDTFNLSTGKYYISEEVIRCFKGESGSSFNKEGGYFYQTIPVYDPADEKKIQGVIAVTASMENVVSVTERVKSSAQLFFLCMALVAILFSIMSAHFLVRPFKRLLRSFDRVAQGDLDADISEDAYSETRQMSQAVQKSLRKLKAVDQSRQEFVSNVSHELKTPLTSIVGYLELIKKEELSDVVRDYVDVISTRAGKLGEMINSLFSLAKASSGNVELHKETFELNRLMEQIFADMDDRIKESGLKFVTQLTEEDTAIYSDNSYFYRICQNLVENALKYSAKGTRVFIKTYKKEAGTDQKMVLEITNTSGYEMDFEKEDIIERFSRGDKARTSEGNGLGLAIVSTYVKALGGEFDIKVDCDQFKAIVSI